MKRRGFLGLFGGAVAAGPSALTNVVATATPISGETLLAAGSKGWTSALLDDEFARAIPMADEGEFRLKRVAELRGYLANGIPEDRDTRTEARSAEMAIHALGSVSPVNKVRMLKNAIVRIKNEDRRRYWLEELLQYGERP